MLTLISTAGAARYGPNPVAATATRKVANDVFHRRQVARDRIRHDGAEPRAHRFYGHYLGINLTVIKERWITAGPVQLVRQPGRRPGTGSTRGVPLHE
jgi:hypothetical protein